MKEILLNLANLECLKLCKEHNIDCSGSYIQKKKRGFTYSLVRQEDLTVLVTITFYKNRVPSYAINKI